MAGQAFCRSCRIIADYEELSIMATGIRITCPKCQQQMTVPESVRGKKVRCKNCEGVVPVPEAEAAKGPDQRITTAKAQQATTAAAEGEDKNPLAVRETSLAPRCPHCAYELDPPDSKICLHCGYHMVRRRRVPSVTTFERSGGDWFMWLLPAFLCIILAALLIGYCFFHHLWLPGLVLHDRDVKEIERYRINPFSDYAKWDESTSLLFYWPIQMWLFLILAYAAYRCLKFAFVRLVLDYLPPETVKER
jgi:DNA-directed RNA polymerase subunit M/transcription elongation factor TFIIS